MKILLLGGNGQVGWELQRALAPLGELIVPGAAGPGQPPRADLTQPEALSALVQAVAPQVIVNAAAHTAVDKAESEPTLALAINAAAPAVLAREAAARGALLLHYSSDYVFDGSGDAPRNEDAATAPLGVYGHSKLAGEVAIRASGCAHLILRTSWVYSARGGNFARTMLRLAAERDALSVVADQVGAPTGAELIADVSALALLQLRSRPELAGTYHCVASGATSWFAYAQFVIEAARDAGQTVKVARDAIHAVPSSAYPTPARRPLNSRLDTRKLQSTFGLTLPPWQAGVSRMLGEVLGR